MKPETIATIREALRGYRRVVKLTTKVTPEKQHIIDNTLAAIDAALADIAQPYAHRNGETEPPTEAGVYFVQHPRGWLFPDSIVVYINRAADGHCSMTRCGFKAEYTYDQIDPRIRWWGPVPPMPDDVREAIEVALYFLRSSDRTEMHGNQSERIDTALAWLDAHAQEPTP